MIEISNVMEIKGFILLHISSWYRYILFRQNIWPTIHHHPVQIISICGYIICSRKLCKVYNMFVRSGIYLYANDFELLR